MPLPFWEVEKIGIKGFGPFETALILTCTRCGYELIVRRSWHRINTYGTAPCPYCFKTSRIPNQPRRKHG